MPNTEEQELNTLADMLESAWVSPYITHNKDRWLDVAKVVESHIQAKQLEAREDEIDLMGHRVYSNKETRILDGTPGGRPGFSTESAGMMVYLRQRRSEIQSLRSTPNPVPGFENTMSDLDKLTVKDNSNE